MLLINCTARKCPSSHATQDFFELTQSSKKVIGRTASCDMTLDHGSVSRTHARVERASDGRLWVQDHQSLNGTYLQRSGQWMRIEKINLCREDRIRFGDFEVEPQQLVSLYGPENRVWLPRLPEISVSANAQQGSTTQASHDGAGLQKPRRNPVTGQIEENTP